MCEAYLYETELFSSKEKRKMSDSGVIVLGLALGMMVGMLASGVRAVLLAIRRGGDTDFWNIKDK